MSSQEEGHVDMAKKSMGNVRCRSLSMKHERCSVQELDVLLEVRQGSILETELEYLRCQQRELPVLDHFDTLNAECSNRCSQQSHDSSF